MRASEDDIFAVAALGPRLERPYKGGLVFVVDDILVAYVVLPYGHRLLTKGQDWLFNWLDSQLGEGATKLKQLMSGRHDEVEILKDLGHYVMANPGTAETLATAAYAAATASPEAKEDIEFLTVVRDYFLRPAIEMIKVLDRPVVLSGFLTGTDWLTAIDLRTVPRDEVLENMDVRQRTDLYGEPYPAEIVLWKQRLPYEDKHWLPRIWLIKTVDEELARQLDTTPGDVPAALDELAHDEETTPAKFADALEHQPYVTAITRQRVIVRRAQMIWGISPPSTTDPSDKIPWAKSSAGIQTMRKELEKQLGDKQDEQERWRQALMNWASGWPAADGG